MLCDGGLIVAIFIFHGFLAEGLLRAHGVLRPLVLILQLVRAVLSWV